jgi:hypothetical protein
VTLSLASLPSLGVSSLDLGRTGLRAAPFIWRAGRRRGSAQVWRRESLERGRCNPSNNLLASYCGAIWGTRRYRAPLFGGGAALEQEG